MSVVVFALVHLSGDPVLLMVSPDAPPDVVTTMRHALGFDRPPDRMSAGAARRERGLVAKRAVVPPEGGEDDAALL